MAYAAAIGGNGVINGANSQNAANITIQGGTIYAVSAGTVPGIGVGYSWSQGAYGGSSSSRQGSLADIYIDPISGGSIYAEIRTNKNASKVTRSNTFTSKTLVGGSGAETNLSSFDQCYFYCTTTMPDVPTTGDALPLTALMLIACASFVALFLCVRKRRA